MDQKVDNCSMQTVAFEQYRKHNLAVERLVLHISTLLRSVSIGLGVWKARHRSDFYWFLSEDTLHHCLRDNDHYNASGGTVRSLSNLLHPSCSRFLQRS